MGTLGLYTKFTTQTGQRDRLVDRLLRAAQLMEQAPGCTLYLVNTSPDDPAAVWVTEVWASEEQHCDSLSLSGVPALIQETLPLLALPPEQIRLAPVGGKGLPA
jgi:quinol monooxygenase YgiN